jgi:ligand-binding sensor domain-containing protein/signal transduction histidine kinase
MSEIREFNVGIPFGMAARLQMASATVIMILLITAYGALALDPSKAITQYHQDVWTERNGLPQGSVQAITQTRDGYLWVGTRDGLARFDGVAFTVFRAETHSGMRANDIRALCEDRHGRLWIGTFNGGLSCYSNGTLKAYTTKDGLPSNGVLEIFEDANGVVWFGTWNGLARFESGRFAVYHADGLMGRNGLSMCEDRQGRLCVATEAAVHRWAGDRFEALTNANQFLESPIRQIYVTDDSAMWIASVGEGVFRLHEGNITRYTRREGLPDNKVRAVLQDRDGNMWIGTWSGLCRLKNQNLATLTKQDGLPHDYIECLYEDSEGSLWVGTRGGGLARLRDGKFSNFTTREGLAHNFAKCVLEARDGALWIGTHGGGLSCYRDRRFTNFTTEHGLSSSFVWAIEEDQNGNIWVGTGRPASLHLFKEGKFIAYGKHQGLGVRNGVRAIAADNQGNLWLGGDGGGLCRFRDGVFTCFKTEDGLPSSLVRVIRQDKSGDLWIGTNDGLCRYRNGHFICYTTENGLAHNAVYAILQDSSGELWFGTQGGLSHFVEGRFRSYTSRDGLFQNVIYRVLEDDKRNFWMSSNRGVFSVARQAFDDFDHKKITSLPWLSYGIADGMKSVQCEGGSQPAGWRDKENKLWFPTANGVTMIDPDNLRSNLPAPPVFIEQIRVGKLELDARVPARLPPGAHEFRFHYTALSFTAPEKVRFKYKLDGLDKKWVDAETRRVAFYNEIPPGNYCFRVLACNSDGVWNQTGASFAFILAPHFYQTAWFFGLCGLAMALAAWTFHRQRMKRARAQFALILAERNRIARDLHDTLAQGFAGIAFQLEAVATKLTEAPAQATQHLNVALQMVRHSLAEARRSVLNLRSAALETGELGRALAETARQMTADKTVDVELVLNGSIRPISATLENHLLRIGQEAITNALKYARAGKIQIQVDYREAALMLRIRDDGRGFNPAATQDNQEPHFGLLGMRERAKQMGATLSIRSHADQGTEVAVEVALD